MNRATSDQPHKPLSYWAFVFAVVVFGSIYAVILTRDQTVENHIVVIAPTQDAPVVNVEAVLMLPTSTMTMIPTVRPTAGVTVTVDPRFNDCGSPRPGYICQIPETTPTLAPNTPMPSCYQADLAPGDWCMWPTEPGKVGTPIPEATP